MKEITINLIVCQGEVDFSVLLGEMQACLKHWINKCEGPFQGESMPLTTSILLLDEGLYSLATFSTTYHYL